MEWINTVTGKTKPGALGMTLVHEHLLIGYPGWFMDGLAPKFHRAESLAKAVDRMAQLKDHGVATFLDPCPMDLGRDVEFMAEVSQRTGMQIICATGAYKQNEGITYTFGALPVEEITQIYVKELTEGIGTSGIRAGIVKVATGAGNVTDYERKLITAAGRAAAQVGCPVLTHTDEATCGLDQIAILVAEGVPAHRILIGHSDGRDDHGYHRAIADKGAYVGFDRFGIESLIPDEKRIESVRRMVEAGYARSICMSQDSVCTWLGRPVFGGHMVVTSQMVESSLPNWEPTHIFRNIVPELKRRGVTDADIRTIFVDNPRRYFEGVEAPR